MSVAAPALCHHLAVGDVERGEQCRPDVVVGDTFDVAETERQHRLPSFERLDLPLRTAGNDPASDSLVPASLSAAPRHLTAARRRWRQPSSASSICKLPSHATSPSTIKAPSHSPGQNPCQHPRCRKPRPCTFGLSQSTRGQSSGVSAIDEVVVTHDVAR